MLFSSVGPCTQGVYLRLFRTIPEAASAGPSRSAWPIAIRYRAEAGRIVPMRNHAWAFDSDWWSSAYELGDGSIIARAPIPVPLWLPRHSREPREG